MKLIVFTIIMLLTVGCSAPKPKKMPDNTPEYLNNSFSSDLKDNSIQLNSHDKLAWNVVYVFHVDNNQPILKPQSYIDFMYHIQNATEVMITSSNEHAIASFIRWNKINQITNAPVKYDLTNNKSNLFQIKAIKK